MTSASRERAEGGRAHGALQLVARIEQSGRVEHDHLRVVRRADADDAIARGLRLLADDGQLLADDAVEERGLAGVGLSDDGDDSGACHWECRRDE